jgi:hypothetical protein
VSNGIVDSVNAAFVRVGHGKQVYAPPAASSQRETVLPGLCGAWAKSMWTCYYDAAEIISRKTSCTIYQRHHSPRDRAIFAHLSYGLRIDEAAR